MSSVCLTIKKTCQSPHTLTSGQRPPFTQHTQLSVYLGYLAADISAAATVGLLHTLKVRTNYRSTKMKLKPRSPQFHFVSCPSLYTHRHLQLSHCLHEYIQLTGQIVQTLLIELINAFNYGIKYAPFIFKISACMLLLQLKYAQSCNAATFKICSQPSAPNASVKQ